MEQTNKIIELPNTGYAPENAAIAKHLYEQADWIAAEDSAPIRTVIVIIEYDDGDVHRNICGKPCDLARAVGLMHLAAR